MPELRDALREATNKIGVIAGDPQLIVFDAMLTSYPAITIAGPIGFGVNPGNAFAGASATIELIANGANVPTFAGITASGSWVNTANAVNRIHFECLPSGAGSALAFYARISQPTGSPAAGVTSVAGKTGAVTLDKGDVGLGAANNTADADKPISTATATALIGLSAATQPRDSDLTAIAGLPNSNGLIRKTSDGNAALQPISVTGAAVLGGDAAAGRAAIGVGSLGTREILDVGTIEGIQISKSYLTNSSADGTYLYLSKYALSDRLSGANQKYNIAYTGTATSVDAPFDGSSDSSSIISPGTTQIWEIDFAPYVPYTPNGYSGYTFERGGFVASFAYGVLPANLKVEVRIRDDATGLDTWVTRIDKSSGFVAYKAYLERLGFANFLKKMRVSVTAGASTCYVAGFEYFPEAPNSEEESYALSTASGSPVQRCYTPVVVRNASGTATTEVGAGTIKLNTGAIVSQILTATKTAAGTNPETVSVTGAASGDVAWISEAVPAKVTAPNTVSFNGTGLSGTIRAVVMRAQ